MFPRSLPIALAAAVLVLGCSKTDDNCPGLCPDETLMPTMTITTADGAPSIASAKIWNSPCALVLLHSAGEVGVPTGYTTIQVTYAGPRDIPPLCIVEARSLYGQVESIAAQVTSRPYTQTCCPYGACCPKSNDALTQRYHLEFDHATQTISFPPPPDGGTNDDAADAADAPAGDGSRELDSAGVDGGTLDSSPLDTGDLDGSAVDAASEIDVALDT